jgi:hypothetical protein
MHRNLGNHNQNTTKADRIDACQLFVFMASTWYPTGFNHRVGLYLFHIASEPEQSAGIGAALDFIELGIDSQLAIIVNGGKFL